jgi:hypothetical protein
MQSATALIRSTRQPTGAPLKNLLLLTAAITVSLAGAEPASAQTGPNKEFLCGAKASQQRLVPGSAARRAFIQQCMAAPTAEPTPQRPQPKASEPPTAQPAQPVRPTAPRPAGKTNGQPSTGQSVEFACGARASQQGLIPGSAARATFIQQCIARAKPPRKD